MNARVGQLPAREEILVDRGWRAAHAFDSSLAGWVILAPTRHVTALDQLAVDEASALGELLVRLSRALRDVVGCARTYTMLYAEEAGFDHLHFHVVPRMPDFGTTQIGPNVFTFLGRPPNERLSDDAQDEIAQRLREAVFRT